MTSAESKQAVLGLTGPFGSGCSTLTEVLQESHTFSAISLSDFVKEEWQKNNPGADIEKAPREELQATGDALRLRDGPDVLAKMAVLKTQAKKESDNLVFDSIRNTGEVEYLRRVFPNLFLIALDCPENHRWSRVQKRYNGNYSRFLEDDSRDKSEDGLFGQQVSLCVDDADIIIRNDNDDMIKTKVGWKERLNDKIRPYIKFFEGTPWRLPTTEETYMSIAYTASLKSHCFKRQVGAVIIDQMGKVVSVGYNDNPAPLKPCIDGFYGCFRDGYIDEVMSNLKFCPECGQGLADFKYPYRCPKCKHDLCRQVIPDRALGRCSALHAEERAIIDSGRQDLRGCTLYVTAFPCFTCTQKILDTGISVIWYAESYPDADGLRAFGKAGTVSLQKFEGVKARAYFRLFPQWRAKQEDSMLKKRMSQWK